MQTTKLRRIFITSLRRYSKDIPKKEPEKPKKPDIKKQLAIEKFQQKAVRVSILGADTLTGEALSVLLKQNPLVSHLYLHGDHALGVACDLEHIDTRTIVSGFHVNDLDKAVRRAEIIVILGVDATTDHPIGPEEKVRSEINRLVKLTKVCTMYAPKSIVCVCVQPISISVPLVAGIFKKTHWYHPGRIIGVVELNQVRLNSLVAKYNQLDPAGVHVPIVGGPDVDSLVPLLSRATPIGLPPLDAESMMKEFRNIPECEPVTFPIPKMIYDPAPMAQGFALNRFLTTVALGLLGDQNANITGFIRSNILPTCKHLVTTLRVGPGGIVHNYGLPRLNGTELALFEKAALLLHERETRAIEILEDIEYSNSSAQAKIESK